MADITFITANKNYSLWTLPVWLCLKIAGLDFDEVTIPFSDPDARARFDDLSPTGSIPVLKHGDVTIWDSAAICEYIAELAPGAGLWPDDRSARAMARSVVADITSFSGAHWSAVEFVSVGAFMPTNVRQRTGPIAVPENIQKIFDRSTKIWCDCRASYRADGPFLFGRFSIADAMSAPLVNRFVTYNVPLDPVAADYRDTMRAHPSVLEYVSLAEAEPWRHEPSERPFA
jgi:glutathione S-transferase